MSNKILTAVRLVSAVASIGFIIASMIIEESNSYLAVGLALLAVANVINWKTGRKGYNPCRKKTNPED